MFKKKVKKKISLLVPFQTNEEWRVDDWRWLHHYWREFLPHAEIIIGRDKKSKKKWYCSKVLPFSKTAAVNNAFSRSSGDIIVILDADTYIDPKIIVHCAKRIRESRKMGARVWFIPYLWLYRLTKEATKKVLDSEPREPYTFSTPPSTNDVESTDGSGHGRKYGALIQIMPREAFELVGGMDEEFRGWGGEDVSFLWALDTLWTPHSNTPNDVLHLWHPRIIMNEGDSNRRSESRGWEGQEDIRANDWLSDQYRGAIKNPTKMRALVKARKKKPTL